MLKPIRLLLADDHDLFRAGVRALLESLPDIEVVAEAGNGREALRLCQIHQPDIALIDIRMPELNGLEVTARLSAVSPNTRPIILSMNSDQEYVLHALRVGASGYLLKSATPADLEQAIRSVAQGETYLSTSISTHVIAAYLQLASPETEEDARLTPRQREVLQLIAEGNTTKAISRKLGLGVKTVETHRALLMQTLGIRDIAGLVRYAIRRKMIDPEK